MTFRNISPAMEAHLQQTVTSLVKCVRITPAEDKFAVEEFYTEHNKKLVIDGYTYNPAPGVKFYTITNSINFTSDNTQIDLYLKSTDNPKERIENLIDANIDIFMVNWGDLSQGKVELFRGFVSQANYTKSTEENKIELTILSRFARLAKRKFPKYSVNCRTKLGSEDCGVPIFPFLRKNAYLSFTRTYTIGDQGYVKPTGTDITPSSTSWNPIIGSWTNTSGVLSYPSTNTLEGSISTNIDISTIPDGDIISFESLVSGSNYKYRLNLKDSSGTVLHSSLSEYQDSNKNEYSTIKIPNSTTLEIILYAQPNNLTTFSELFLVHFDIATVSKTRKKLARITNRSYQDKLLVENYNFYKSNVASPTCDTTAVPDWDIVCSGFYTTPSTGISGVDFTISQVLGLPTLGCTLLTDGCYYIDIRMPNSGGTLTTKVELLSTTGGVLQTETSTGQEHRFRLVNDPNLYEIRISFSFDTVNTTTLDYVELYLINSMLSAANDPSSISIASLVDIGTNYDIWQDETDSIWYETTVTSVDAINPNRVFTVDTTGFVSSENAFGSLVFLTGQNAGRVYHIRGYNETTGSIETFNNLKNTINIGDRVVLAFFCGKDIKTCGNVFNNSINFRGEPYIPSVEQIEALIS